MSFQTLKRFAPYAAIILSVASTAFAAAPSSRTGARAVYDEVVESVVLFGGTGSPDAATLKAYDHNETWEFDGTRWIRRFVASAPPARHSHVMVYDSNRDQTIVFGGRSGNTTFFNDTWAYRGDWFNRHWVEIETPAAPVARQLGAAAFDPIRDRVILYGGQRLSDDEKTVVDTFDTWEFDGTTWTRIIEEGPKVYKPLLAYDASRNQLILVGHGGDVDLTTKMYTYDSDARAWNESTPEHRPPCINESSIAYDSDTHKVFVIGGVCVPSDVTKSSPTTEELWAWDGTDWAKVEDDRLLFRGINAAFAYDAKWKSLVIFGGMLAYTANPRSDTNMYRDENWISPPPDVTSPTPRSLYAMASDPVHKVIWLLGGLSESSLTTDFWKFENGFWGKVDVEGIPQCTSPVAAFDTNRARLVVVCGDSSTFEFDGEAWKEFEGLRTVPEDRRFSHLVYDENLRKAVLFGGFNSIGDYLNKTWTWDGTSWTEVKARKRPHFRALATMWYDPILRRTVVYGGIGRKEREGRLERFNDMWSFDGSTWTELKPAAVPPTRYGAQVAVDPNTGRAILFGGLRLETENNIQRQVYANDTWEWNGTTWRQLETEGSAAARENAAMAWDYSGSGFITFGGWAGYYLSDTWRFDENRWTVLAE